MLSLTRKSDYGLVALAFLAKRRLEADPVSSREIAEFFGMPPALLSNILKDLAKARIVESVRGATGGYVLAREPEDVSVWEVVIAIEGHFQFSKCSSTLPIVGQGCEMEDRCPIRVPIRNLHKRISGMLEQTRLSELLEQEPQDPALETVAVTASA